MFEKKPGAPIFNGQIIAVGRQLPLIIVAPLNATERPLRSALQTKSRTLLRCRDEAAHDSLQLSRAKGKT